MFKTYSDMTSRLNESQILQIVNNALAARAKQRAYHKAYNQRNKALARAVNEAAKAKGVSVDEILDSLAA